MTDEEVLKEYYNSFKMAGMPEFEHLPSEYKKNIASTVSFAQYNLKYHFENCREAVKQVLKKIKIQTPI